MPTTDQVTGVQDAANEPTETLLTFRRGRGEKGESSVFFGMNLTHRWPPTDGTLEISVGDEITVLEEADVEPR